MIIRSKKDIPTSFIHRFFRSLLDWTIFQSIALILFYYLGREVGPILAISYFTLGITYIFNQQRKILVSLKLSDSVVEIKLLHFNTVKVYNIKIRNLEIIDNSVWLGLTYKFRNDNFKYVMRNGYYWKGKEMKELLDKFNSYKSEYFKEQRAKRKLNKKLNFIN